MFDVIKSSFKRDFQYINEQGIDFTNLLPKETILEIFSNLNSHDLAALQLVNKKCKVLTSPENLCNLKSSKIIFGKDEWMKYAGDVGEEPPLPKDIHKILKRPCPFFPMKRVEETHILMLIPETINGEPYTLPVLKELAKNPKSGNPLEFYLSPASQYLLEEHSNPTKSHWVLRPVIDVMEGSKNESFEDEICFQKRFIFKFAEQTGMNYEVADVIEAATCFSMKYISSKIQLSSKFSFSKDRNNKSVMVGFNNFDNRLVISKYTLYRSGIGLIPLIRFL